MMSGFTYAEFLARRRGRCGLLASFSVLQLPSGVAPIAGATGFRGWSGRQPSAGGDHVFTRYDFLLDASITRCMPTRREPITLTIAASSHDNHSSLHDRGLTGLCFAAARLKPSRPIRTELHSIATNDHTRRRVGLFLDVDGTLLDLAPRPDEVVVPTRTVMVLTRLKNVLDGALALVSGRSIRQLDALFAPLTLPCAGVHGNERRDCMGQMHYLAPDAAQRLDVARALLSRFVETERGLLLEDKRTSLALHFRKRPELAGIVEQQLELAKAQVGEGFRIQESVLVRELVPTVARKGDAVEAFLAEPTFAGRMPVFVGDDVTDLHAFAAVERHGGRAVAVGECVTAPLRLPGPSAVIEWLELLVRTEGRLAS
ncbi:MAG: trehalose-phosphatase [Lysobacterales bacterium]|nr:MAG: trehalose-phosphatase [Xanthomonadales bacterium]